MKFLILMKDPDGVSSSVERAIREWPEAARTITNGMRKWFEYDEYLSVEVDTVKGTCTVLPKGRG